MTKSPLNQPQSLHRDVTVTCRTAKDPYTVHMEVQSRRGVTDAPGPSVPGGGHWYKLATKAVWHHTVRHAPL